MKTIAGHLDGVPRKRLFLGIISDYDLNRSICELIDNALDNWSTNNKKSPLKIDLTIDTAQQTILIKDNSGGVKESDLENVISPGATGNDPNSEIIGIFGVGTKRAVVALAKDVKIKSRFKDEKTFLVEFDDDWIKENEDWGLDYYGVDEIEESNTIVQLQSLRFPIDEGMVNVLKEHLQCTYAKFLDKDDFSIIVNNDPITAKTFEDWAYPPSYEPKKFKGILTLGNGEKVKVRILVGLSKEASPITGEYGVYFYCNNRLIARATKDLEVGFGTGLAGKPHPNVSLMKVIVSLEGSAVLMPWNTSKSEIHYTHIVFKTIRRTLMEIVKHYAKVSRAFEGMWREGVYEYKTGKITAEKIVFTDIPRLHLPPVPSTRRRYPILIKEKNKKILNDKPWTKGLLGGIIATELISKKKFDENNRIALIVLDSTLEIAFKEFLVKESGQYYSDKKLYDIFQKRHLVEEEVKKYHSKVKIGDTDWGKIRHYYDIRCKLIHQSGSVGVTPSEVEDYRSVVEKVLKRMFKLKFK